jgi:hypothetical protein
MRRLPGRGSRARRSSLAGDLGRHAGRLRRGRRPGRVGRPPRPGRPAVPQQRHRDLHPGGVGRLAQGRRRGPLRRQGRIRGRQSMIAERDRLVTCGRDAGPETAVGICPGPRPEAPDGGGTVRMTVPRRVYDPDRQAAPDVMRCSTSALVHCLGPAMGSVVPVRPDCPGGATRGTDRPAGRRLRTTEPSRTTAHKPTGRGGSARSARQGVTDLSRLGMRFRDWPGGRNWRSARRRGGWDRP